MACTACYYSRLSGCGQRHERSDRGAGVGRSGLHVYWLLFAFAHPGIRLSSAAVLCNSAGEGEGVEWGRDG